MHCARLIIFALAFGASSYAFCANAIAQTKLGIVSPVTGPFATWGSEILKGADLAAADINSHGGIDGAKIELIKIDDSCQPDRAALATQTLIEREKVNALIGYPCAAAALAGAQIATKSNVLMISLATAPSLTQPNQPILRIIGRDDRLTRFVADYVAANFRNKKIATWLFANQTSFNSSLNSALNIRGIKIDRAETTSMPTTSLPAWTDQVDVMVTPASVARNFKETQSAKLTMVIPTTIAQSSIADIQKQQNVVVISNPRPDFFEGATEIAKRAGFSNPNDSGYALYGYAAVQLFASLASQSKNDLRGTALANIARTKDSQTAIGKLVFDQNGDVQNWRFAVYGASYRLDVCKAPTCRQYESCPPDCPK